MKSLDCYYNFIEKNIDVLFDKGVFVEFLKFCTKFPEQSYINQILLFFQNPEALYVLPTVGWLNYDRQVLSDERALCVINPIFEGEKGDVVDEYGNLLDKDLSLINRVSYVYDISQTKGDDSIILTKYHINPKNQYKINAYLNKIKNPLIKESINFMISFTLKEKYDVSELYNLLKVSGWNTAKMKEFFNQLQFIYYNLLKEISDLHFSYIENYILNSLLEEPVEHEELLYRLSSIKVQDSSNTLQKSLDVLFKKIELLDDYDEFLDMINIF